MFLKSVKFVVTTSVLSSLKCTKIRFRPGLRPGPRWGAYSAIPDPLAGGRGLAAPSPNTTPALGPSGLSTRDVRL